jgi:hypothetical protein
MKLMGYIFVGIIFLFGAVVTVSCAVQKDMPEYNQSSQYARVSLLTTHYLRQELRQLLTSLNASCWKIKLMPCQLKQSH